MVVSVLVAWRGIPTKAHREAGESIRNDECTRNHVSNVEENSSWFIIQHLIVNKPVAVAHQNMTR